MLMRTLFYVVKNHYIEKDIFLKDRLLFNDLDFRDLDFLRRFLRVPPVATGVSYNSPSGMTASS